MANMAKSPTKFILATKLGMTEIFNDRGEIVPVTLLNTSTNIITQIKTIENDGYAGVQIGFGSKKAKRLSKGLKGHLKNLGSFRWMREFKSTKVGDKDLVVGDTINASVFAPGDIVKVSGLTKGHGFTGAVKRHGFHGAPASHGSKHVIRRVGSIGQRFPQHTLKGMRGPGRDGQDRVSIRALRVAIVDNDKNIIAVSGAVPGAKGTLVEITSQ